MLNHPFSHPDQHPRHVERLAAYWAEVLGGPETFSGECSDQSAMLRLHAGNGELEELGRRFVDCFLTAADDAACRRTRSSAPSLVPTSSGRSPTCSSHPDSPDTVPDGLPMPHWSWDGQVILH